VFNLMDALKQSLAAERGEKAAEQVARRPKPLIPAAVRFDSSGIPISGLS
jgi:hypothetical protein